jgi:hypothetical protein
MSLDDLNPDQQTIDPPDNQGGGNLAATGSDAEALATPDAAPIDPPDNQGGGN